MAGTEEQEMAVYAEPESDDERHGSAKPLTNATEAASAGKNKSQKDKQGEHKHNHPHSKNSSEHSHSHDEDDEEQNDMFFIISAAIIEGFTLIMYAFGADYHDANSGSTDAADYVDTSMESYSTYQDVHVMMFIGFGFLMTFLRKYGFGAISFNMLITAVALQWGMFVFHWVATGKLWNKHDEHNDERFVFETEHLVDGDIAAAVGLISFGAVIGRTSPTQLLWMVFFELIVYSFNFYICVELLHIVDVGGSIVVHTFGCYFGLAVSYVLGKPRRNDDNKSMYHSDLFAMIGTLFLWIYWPSFNGFFASSEGFYRDRAFINTILSLSGCTVASFMFSKMFTEGKFDMVHIQNATLAGGVAVGAAADLYIHPSGAISVGIVAALVSVLGYVKLQDKLEGSIKLWDTCGVHNLHGMPGVLGGVVSAIAIWAADGNDLYDGGSGCGGDGTCPFYYSYGKQGGMQIAALAVTLGMAIGSGLLIGMLIKKLDEFNPFRVKSWYHDNDNWEIPKSGRDIFRGTIRGRDMSRDMDDFEDDYN